MKTEIAVMIACCAAVLAPPASAQGVLIQNGFVTGEAYLHMSDVQQRAYAIGLVDGTLLAPLFSAAKEDLLWLERCIAGMRDTQMAEILRRRLQAHPESWHSSAHAQMFAALKEQCPTS